MSEQPDWGQLSPKQLLGRITLGIAWGTAIALLLVVVLRLVAHDATMSLIWLNSATFYLYLPAYVIALGAGLLRRFRLATTALLVTAAHVCWVVPDVASTRAPSLTREASTELTVFSANLLSINMAFLPMLQELRDADPDVILLQEYSSNWRAALRVDGIHRDYPHHIERVRDDSFGTAIFSRTPLLSSEVIEVEALPMSRVAVELGGRRLDILNVHTLPPRLSSYVPVWRRQMNWLEEFAIARCSPLLIAGDFNATQHAASYHALLEAGLIDSHREFGRGLATTFPNGVFALPPVRLDHVLHSEELACVAVAEGQGLGSDHRPVTVTLRWAP